MRKYYPRRNKYYNRFTKCLKGHTHASKGEANYCNELRLRELAGDIESYNTQITFDLKVNGIKICSHRVDFVIKEGNKLIVEEFKGFETDVFKIKKKLFEAIYPKIEYKVIKNEKN
jgi:hypothetical protein